MTGSVDIEIVVGPEVGPAPSEGLCVELVFPEAVWVFEMAAGKDMGDYLAPSGSFVQRCIRSRDPDVPHVFVDFRPDRDSDRTEIVVWNGECMADVPSNYWRDLPAYTALIKDGERLLDSIEIPHHGWACRWRWQSAPRPLVRTAEQVFAEGWLPRMTQRAARIEGYSGIIVPPVPPAVQPYRPFRGPDTDNTNYKCLIQLAVDGGGERREIGLVTEWQADWLLRGSPSSLDAMLQQAEMWGGDWSLYVPDKGTGAAINYKQDQAHYDAYTYNRVYGRYYRITKGEQQNGWDFHEAEAHFPALGYVPYALTEDAYFLESMQFACQWAIGWDIYDREQVYGKMGVFPIASYIGEIRTYGWGIRNLAMAYKCSPDSPPRWLQPKQYFADASHDYSMIANNLWTTSDKPLHRIFRQLSNDNYWQAFMQAYAIMGMSLADLVGMPTGDAPTWKQQLEFYFGWFAEMLDGVSGWDRQAPQPHDIYANEMNAETSWAAAWNMVKTKYPYNAQWPDAPSPQNRQGGSMGNCSQIVAACACAMSRGIAAAPAAKAWMDEFIDFNYAKYPSAEYPGALYIPFYAKCGFDGT